ncbi:hypothetical protein HY639_01035 [Candidatus Woesearchaeota archaeon]|nr:hypothetical protein [Candidatus Woesearchaeota archaeon]
MTKGETMNENLKSKLDLYSPPQEYMIPIIIMYVPMGMFSGYGSSALPLSGSYAARPAKKSTLYAEDPLLKTDKGYVLNPSFLEALLAKDNATLQALPDEQPKE